MTDTSELKAQVRRSVDAHAKSLVELSHRIHDHPEVGFHEEKASEWCVDLLQQNGIKAERNVANLPTAFRADTGNGTLHVGICCEYDALPNIGHACGHNIIAAAGIGAALALAPLTSQLDITVRVLGTPAEEGGGGKVFMLQRGTFDGLHAAMMVHPSRIERTVMPTLATSQWDVEFFGKSAHAAAAPQRGVSASAAVALAQMGIGMLREHLLATDRIHGIVRNGGDAPNIVPEYTKSSWFVRSATVERRTALEKQFIDVFKGAAIMTGCSLEMRQMSPGLTEIRTDDDIAHCWTNNAETLGRNVLPVQSDDGAASTDMGNVSYVIPSIHPLIAIDSGDANIHEAEFEQATSGKSADDAISYAAKALAMTAIDIATDSNLRSRLLAKTFRNTEYSESDATIYFGVNFDKPLNFGGD
jgi:amidohydrolase